MGLQDVPPSHAAHEASRDLADDQAAANKKQARSAKRNTPNEPAQVWVHVSCSCTSCAVCLTGNSSSSRCTGTHACTSLQATPDDGAEMDVGQGKGAGGAAARRRSKQSRRNSKEDAAEELATVRTLSSD
jgi:hypothetical protein